MSRACINSACNLTTAAAAAELPRDWRENHLNFSHFSSANPTKVRNQLRPTVRQFFFRFTEDWLEITQFVKTVEGRESTAKIWVQIACASGVSEMRRRWWWARQNRSLGNIRRCHLYDAACTRVRTCTCTAVHSRLTWSFYFMLFYFILFYIILKIILKNKFLTLVGVFVFVFFFWGEGSFLM